MGWLSVIAGIALLVGGGVGSMVLVFPLGGAFLVFVLIYFGSMHTHDAYQHFIGRKLRKGITEFPTGVSVLLHGENENTLEFSSDGTSIVATLNEDYLSNQRVPEGLRAAIKDRIRENCTDLGDYGHPGWADLYQIERIHNFIEPGPPQVRITLPADAAMSSEYIEEEMRYIGRVFTPDGSSATKRRLHYPQGGADIMDTPEVVMIRISRRQAVPGIFDSKIIYMSERQITRNIKNRLWNSVEVECTSMDDAYYYGRILRPDGYNPERSRALVAKALSADDQAETVSEYEPDPEPSRSGGPETTPEAPALPTAETETQDDEDRGARGDEHPRTRKTAQEIWYCGTIDFEESLAAAERLAALERRKLEEESADLLEYSKVWMKESHAVTTKGGVRTQAGESGIVEIPDTNDREQ